MTQPPFGNLRPGLSRNSGTQLPFQTEEGALPAVDADGAPSLLDYVEAGS